MIETKEDSSTSDDGLGEDPIGRNGSPPWSDHSRLFAIASRISKNIDYLFSATWKRVEACQRAIKSLTKKIDKIDDRVAKLDEEFSFRTAKIVKSTADALDVIRSSISEIEKDTSVSESLAKNAIATISEFEDKYRQVLADNKNFLDKSRRIIDNELERFRRIVDDTQSKRILGYITVDECCVEHGASGPMDDLIRVKHEAEIAKVLRSMGGEPGIAKAPFGKMMVTFPRDLVERQMKFSKSNLS